MPRKDGWVLGIDPGTNKAGAVILDGDSYIIHRSTFQVPTNIPIGHKLFRLSRWVRDQVRTARMKWPVQGMAGRIAVERPHVQYVKAALALGKAVGVIILVAEEMGYTGVYEIPPAEEKRALTGDGRADKKKMMWGADAQFGGERPFNEHEADALGVALAGRVRYNEERMRQEA